MRSIQQYINRKINRSSIRSTNAIKNIITSFAIKGISIVVSLLLVPMTIHYVNPMQYGIWLTLSSIIGWFSFFDIGFGNGLRNRFAEAKATGDYDKAKTYVSTTYICIGVIFSIVWILFFFMNFFLDWSIILNTPAQMAKELSIVALIVISFFCSKMVLKLINTVLIADQKPAKSAFFDMLGQILVLIIIFILTKTTQGSLIYLALALGFCPILVMLISSFWFYKRDYKQFSPKVNLFDRKIVKDILKLGGKFFILQLAAVLIYQSTNIIITQLLNPDSVTIYNIAWKYFNIAIMCAAIIFAPFWSAFTEAYKKNDFLWMRNTYKNLLKIAGLLVLVTVILLMISNYAYTIWIGNDIHIPIEISLVVSLTIIFTIFINLQFNLLNGMGKLRVQMIITIFGMILNIPFSIILGKKLGLIGIIIPTLVYNVISCIVYAYQVKLLIAGKRNGIWNK